MKIRSTPKMLVALALAAGPARAAEIHVPRDHPQIHQAAAAAANGDVIKVSKGTYESFALINLTGVSVRGSGRVVVEPVAAEAPLVITGGSDIVIKGLTLRNSLGRGIDVSGASNVRIVNCKVQDCAADGIYFDACDGAAAKNCRVKNVGQFGINLDSDDGVVTGCRVRNTGWTGIRAFGLDLFIADNRVQQPGEYGISIGEQNFTTTGAIVADNRITDAGTSGLAMLKAQDCSVLRNRVTKAAKGIFASPMAPANLFEGNRVRKATVFGLSADSVDQVFRRNRVTRCQIGLSLSLNGNDCVVRRNTIRKSADYGVFVSGLGNTFTRNTATRSGAYDLWDLQPPGANTYSRNRFPNIKP